MDSKMRQVIANKHGYILIEPNGVNNQDIDHDYLI